MFAEKLKQLRKKAGLTQVQFAEAFCISKGTIAMWETGKREPDFATTKRIADFFGVPVGYLLGDAETNIPAPVWDGYDKKLVELLPKLSDDQKEFLLAQIQLMLSNRG